MSDPLLHFKVQDIDLRDPVYQPKNNNQDALLQDLT